MRGNSLKGLAGPVRIQRLSTFDLLAYLDIIGQVQATLTNAANHMLENQKYGGLTADQSTEVCDELQLHMSNYGEAQKRIAKVMNSRFKRDIGVSKTLMEIDKMLLGMSEKYPVIASDMNEMEAKWREKRDLAEQEKLLKELEDQKAKMDVKVEQ